MNELQVSNQHVIPFDDLQRMGMAVAKSGLFGLKTPEQAIALMLVAQSEGKHPASAAREYDIIQGRPALKTDAMLSRFQECGGKVDWKVYTDEKVIGVFSHPNGGTIEIEWTIDRAKQIGLTSKDNWKKYPRNMLRARCVSEGIRAIYPGIICGVYTPEEVSDFSESNQAKGNRLNSHDNNEPAQNVVDTQYDEICPICGSDVKDGKCTTPAKH